MASLCELSQSDLGLWMIRIQGIRTWCGAILLLVHSNLGVINGLEAKQWTPSALHNYFSNMYLGHHIIGTRCHNPYHSIVCSWGLSQPCFLTSYSFPQLQHNFEGDDYDYNVELWKTVLIPFMSFTVWATNKLLSRRNTTGLQQGLQKPYKVFLRGYSW